MFRPRTSYLYCAMILILLAGVGLFKVYSQGVEALWRDTWGWYFFAYTALYVLLRPKLIIDLETITIVNPFRTHTFGYGSITDITTSFLYKVETDTKTYLAFALPTNSPLELAAERDVAMNQAMAGATPHSYGSFNKAAPSGLAGEAVRISRGHWEAMEDKDVATVFEKHSWDVLATLIFLALAAATLFL